MINIQLIPKESLGSIIPMLRILDPNIPEKILFERLDAMKVNNYECVGVYDNNKLIGISGLWFLAKYYVGKHVEPDNVIIHPDYQSQGIGDRLMEWIFEYAKSKGCIASELNCYVSNKRGVKFWERHGYKTIGYHMQKKF